MFIKLDEVIRAVEHMGRPAPHMDNTVISTHFGNLPPVLSENLRETMTNGVNTGVERPKETNAAQASATAMKNKTQVWAQLRKFALNGWVRAFPPSMREQLKDWGLFISSTHYVESPNDRLVIDLTASGVNAASPEEGFTK